MFKILHIPFTFYPDPIGGTEIYVEALAKELNRFQVESVIVAPGAVNTSYIHAGLRVRRYEICKNTIDLYSLYGAGDLIAEDSFAAILDEEKPEIVHLHALTSAISLRTVLTIKRRGIPVVFTYHTPTVTCARGTLLRWGTEICDGQLREFLCTCCLLDKLGVKPPVAHLLATFPPALGTMFDSHQGGIWTALRMRSLIHLKHAATRHFLTEMHRIVVLCSWTQDLLAGNGIPPAKMVLSPHGLTADAPVVTPVALPPPPIKLAFFGRIDPVKGIDLVIRALRELPDAPFTLDIYGITQPGAEKYRDFLVELAGNDHRIVFKTPLPNQAIIPTLHDYHFLVVPSQVLETGPLVVLEAFAAGTPIIGSNLGGIAELVEHEVNGLLVEYNSVSEWKRAFQTVLEDDTLYTKLKAGIRPPRTMADIAKEMLLIYSSLLQ